MSDGMIHIKAKKKKYVEGSRPVKLTEAAYNAVVEIYNESCMSMQQIVSEIILQSLDRIVYDKEGEE